MVISKFSQFGRLNPYFDYFYKLVSARLIRPSFRIAVFVGPSFFQICLKILLIFGRDAEYDLVQFCLLRLLTRPFLVLASSSKYMKTPGVKFC